MDKEMQEQVGTLVGSISNGIDLLAGLLPLEGKTIKARAIATLILSLNMETSGAAILSEIRKMEIEATPIILKPT